jgi:hypothetical protein
MSGYRALGLGCPTCEGTCSGLGQVASFPNFYPPFESFDFTTWGWEEWTIAGLLLYTIISAIGDVKRTGHKVRKTYRHARRSS